jgi:hypothetical protein
MARHVLGFTRCIILRVMRREERSMRFPMLVFAAATVAMACEKGAPLSNSTANLEPAPAATSGIAIQASATPVPSTPVTVSPAAPAPQAGIEMRAGALAPALPPSGVAPVAVAPAAIAPAAHQPTAANDEGNGEPMDDVDDEDVSATDRSGAHAVTHEETADDAPSGPVDDSEGADIELRE